MWSAGGTGFDEDRDEWRVKVVVSGIWQVGSPFGKAKLSQVCFITRCIFKRFFFFNFPPHTPQDFFSATHSSLKHCVYINVPVN